MEVQILSPRPTFLKFRRPSFGGGGAAAARISRGGRTDLGAEVADQVRLIVVAELLRGAGPVHRLAACDALGGFLDPCPANDPLRADTDVALEQPMQGTDGDPGDPVCNTLPRAQG